MVRLKDLNTNAILLWWAQAYLTTPKPLDQVIIRARLAQVDPADLKVGKLRRHIPPLLRARGLLPHNRPPTSRDYQMAAETFLKRWYDQDLN